MAVNAPESSSKFPGGGKLEAFSPLRTIARATGGKSLCQTKPGRYESANNLPPFIISV
jgi:hypothetical protein